MLKGKIVLAIAAIVVFAGLITGTIIFAFRQTSALNDLRLQTDEAVQAMYRLTNNSFSLLYNSDDINEARSIWYSSYLDAGETLDSLASHESLGFIDPAVASQMKQTNNLWEITTSSIIDGNNNLVKYLKYDKEISARNNISDMLFELEQLVIEAESAGDEELSSSLLKHSFPLKQSFISIDATNDNLWYFSISSIENLSRVINTETGRAIRFVLIIASLGGILLLAMLVTAVIISQRILRNANIRLEHQVKERTIAIQNLLDYSGEGFLSFGPDLIVNPEHSKECIDIFGVEVAGRNLAELLYEQPQARTDFNDALSLVFQGISLPEVIFDVIDTKIHFSGKILKLDFHLVDEATIMCQLTDITENEQLQRKIEEENVQREMVLRIVTSKRDFISLRGEADDLFAALESCIEDGSYCADEDKNDDIVRALHTFKGNAGFLRMTETVESAHELETALIDYGVLSDAAPLGPGILKLRTAVRNETEHIVKILGRDWLKEADSVEVELEKLENAKDFIQTNYPDDPELHSRIDQLASLKLSGLFTRLTDLTEQLARSNGKRITVKTKCDDIFVSTELFQRLSDAVGHILRNMVAHGVEFPGHREKAGKPLAGLITINAEQNNGNIELKLSDDGAGISVQKVRAKAIAAGQLDPDAELTDRDYIKMIFQPGFSTADTLTAVSGRGYGLSAVKESIYEAGGKMKVASSRGRGTKFTIIVPNKEKETV